MRASVLVLEIRALSVDGWWLWRELRLRALAESPCAFGSRLADWTGEHDLEERWRARLGIPGSLNVIAFLDGKAVGMASGVPFGDGRACELISMWVAPEARGLGVGDGLIDSVVTWTAKNGARTVRLSVVPGNDAAIAMYRRNGFERSDEFGDLLPDGVGREWVMVRALP